MSLQSSADYEPQYISAGSVKSQCMDDQSDDTHSLMLSKEVSLFSNLCVIGIYVAELTFFYSFCLLMLIFLWRWLPLVWLGSQLLIKQISLLYYLSSKYSSDVLLRITESIHNWKIAAQLSHSLWLFETKWKSTPIISPFQFMLSHSHCSTVVLPVSEVQCINCNAYFSWIKSFTSMGANLDCLAAGSVTTPLKHLQVQNKSQWMKVDPIFWILQPLLCLFSIGLFGRGFVSQMPNMQYQTFDGQMCRVLLWGWWKAFCQYNPITSCPSTTCSIY